MGFSAEAIIDERNIETELAGVLRLELAGLELDDDVAQLLDVEEQQIGVMPRSA